MGRRKQARRQRGYQVRDRWVERGTETGLRFMGRAWDEAAQRYKSKCFGSAEEAEAWAKQKAAKFILGQDTARPSTVADLGARYLEYLRGRDRAERHLQQIEQAFREMQGAGVVDLCADDVCAKAERWLKDMTNHRTGERASPQQKNRFLGYARALSRWARRRQLIPFDRLDAVDPFPEPKPMKEVYTVEELRRLLAPKREGEEMFTYIALMVYLGCRPSEAKNLTWLNVDWATSTVNFPEDLGGNKLKRGYAVPLPPELAEILKPFAKVSPDPIIAERYANGPSHHGLHKAVLRYLADCGVEPRGRPRHAFRNTCASLLTAIRVPWAEIRSLLNHDDMRISADYSKCAVQFRQAVRLWPKDGTFWLRRTVPKSEALPSISSVHFQ